MPYLDMLLSESIQMRVSVICMFKMRIQREASAFARSTVMGITRASK